MKQAQVTPITVFFVSLTFIIGYSLFLASWVNDVAEAMVLNNSLTGIEALVIGNLNPIIFIIFILFIIGYSYFSSIGG